MFKWLENLDTKRWWNMILIIGLTFAILFGTKTITLIDPQAGFLMSVGFILLAIGESANHKKAIQYQKGHISFFNPLSDQEVGQSPELDIPIGYKYVRKPIFIGIVFDIFGVALFLAGIAKLF